MAAGNDLLTQAALRAFELVLLREIGLLPQLDRYTATLQAVGASDACLLRPELGVIEAGAAEAAFSGAQLQRLQAALDQSAMGALQAACAETLGPLKSALRHLLHYHLGTPRLRTRDVMIDAQRLVDSLHTPDPGADTP